MIYTGETKKAIKLIFEKHNGQFDKSGLPYVHHPLHVAEQMDDENTTVAALLHDVVEDTDTSFEELEDMGFSDEVISALRLLTHDPNENYFDYVKGVGKNEIARKVKIKDLEHNMDLSRLDQITSEDLARVNKYKESYDYLSNVHIYDNHYQK